MPTTSSHSPLPKVRIKVQNFGPIAEGTMELRPLTVLVGPSNTGKTYLATLIYALHRSFNGLGMLPVPIVPLILHALSKQPMEVFIRFFKELNSAIEKLRVQKRPLRFSDLPAIARDSGHSFAKDSDLLTAELQHCFEIESVSDLIRAIDHSNARIEMNISDNDQDLWCFCMDISKQGVTADGRIEDTVILSAAEAALESKIGRLFELFVNVLNVKQGTAVQDHLQDVVAISSSGRVGNIHYLPASRSGIMHSHCGIKSSIGAASTRTVEQLSVGAMADFMQKLIDYKQSQSSEELLHLLADALEEEILNGQIRINKPPPGGYPEIVYRPHRSQQDLRLNRASSMVLGLAPMVLFLRGVIRSGDTVLIEEPEAHLHPYAQTRMAVALARLIRAGVQVVITTHSDWLLQAISTLIDQHEPKHDPLPSWLRPHEVGVWLLHQDHPTAAAKLEEIPYHRGDDMAPPGYRDVTAALCEAPAIGTAPVHKE